MSSPEETKEECIEDASKVKIGKYTDWIIDNMPWVEQIDSDNVMMLKKR